MTVVMVTSCDNDIDKVDGNYKYSMTMVSMAMKVTAVMRMMLRKVLIMTMELAEIKMIMIN